MSGGGEGGELGSDPDTDPWTSSHSYSMEPVPKSLVVAVFFRQIDTGNCYWEKYT